MPEVVQFKANDDAQLAIVEILEQTLEEAKRGEIRDIAIVAAVHDKDDGPMHVYRYWGQSAFAVIVAGVSALAFDMQYERHKEREGRE